MHDFILLFICQGERKLQMYQIIIVAKDMLFFTYSTIHIVCPAVSQSVRNAMGRVGIQKNHPKKPTQVFLKKKQ